MKSGNVSYGETLLEDVKKNKVYVVIVSKDTGETSKKKITDKCKYYQVPYFVVLDKETLSKAVGKNNISSIGVKSIGGAKKIENILKGVN